MVARQVYEILNFTQSYYIRFVTCMRVANYFNLYYLVSLSVTT